MNLIYKILSLENISMPPVPWKFERSVSAAYKNSNLIISHGGDLISAFNSIPKSVCHYGSEFLTLSVLELLLKNLQLFC